jgi:hypothetical protein
MADRDEVALRSELQQGLTRRGSGASGAGLRQRPFQRRLNALRAVGSKGLPKQLADGAAFGLGRRHYLFGHIGRQGDGELFGRARHASIITE